MKIYKILNSKLAWAIYFLLLPTVFFLLGQPTPVDNMKRILSEPDGWYFIPCMLLLGFGFWAFCKFAIVDGILLKRVNPSLFLKKKMRWKEIENMIWDFLWLTIPGLIVSIIFDIAMIYMFIKDENFFPVVIFGISLLLAISNFIHISAQKD
jgi:hypothetical protein